MLKSGECLRIRQVLRIERVFATILFVRRFNLFYSVHNQEPWIAYCSRHLQCIYSRVFEVKTDHVVNVTHCTGEATRRNKTLCQVCKSPCSELSHIRLLVELTDNPVECWEQSCVKFVLLNRMSERYKTCEDRVIKPPFQELLGFFGIPVRTVLLQVQR